MTVSNGIKRRKPIYSERSCDCGVTFAPKTSRQKHCSPECRFRAIAEPFQNSTGCWEWPKGYFTKTGYGQFAVDANTPETAHRMAYKVFNGNISQGLCVCHHCDNRACFNPAHLFLGTQQDNMNDMNTKGRGVLPPRMYGAKNPRVSKPHLYAHMKRFDVNTEREIAAMCNTMSIRAVSYVYGCSHGTISRILKGSKDKNEMLANSTPNK